MAARTSNATGKYSLGQFIAILSVGGSQHPELNYGYQCIGCPREIQTHQRSVRRTKKGRACPSFPDGPLKYAISSCSTCRIRPDESSCGNGLTSSILSSMISGNPCPLAENATAGQELVILFQRLQGLIEAEAQTDAESWQLLPVAGRRGSCRHRVARMNLVLDAVQASHHHCRETRGTELADRIREAGLRCGAPCPRCTNGIRESTPSDFSPSRPD